MTELQKYANYIAKANAQYAQDFPAADPAQIDLGLPDGNKAVEDAVTNPDPEEGIKVALSAPLAATKNGKGYIKILVHLFGVGNEGGFLPDTPGAVPGFDNFHFKIVGGPNTPAKLTKDFGTITSKMSVFTANNKVGAWMPDDRKTTIRNDGVICGLQWSDVPKGTYTIELHQFNIGNNKFNDEFDGVAGTTGHKAEFYPNVPSITVTV